MTLDDIVSLIEIALAVAAAFIAWRLNRSITRIQDPTARISLRILLNVVAAIVILLLLLFGLTSGGQESN